MDTNRKTLIADSAIALLASAGAKGLTHRAVDVQAGLPAGSTSFYCRTRHELLSLALMRHAALDMADLQSDAQHMARPDWDQEDFINLLSRRLTDWLSAPKRARLLARIELFLLASRDEALSAIVTQLRHQFLQATEAALSRAGVREPAKVAPMVVLAFDAILSDHILSGGAILPKSQQKALFRKVLSDAQR